MQCGAQVAGRFRLRLRTEAPHSSMGFVPGSCHLLIVTAQVRQAYDDGEPIPQVKEVKFYDRVRRTLDLVGHLVRDYGQGTPKALFGSL